MGADKTKSIMTLSSGVSQPLLADVQYFELYSSSALNRKLKNIVLPGFYCGFEPVPGTGLSVRITSENSEGKGAASVDVNNVQISVQQIEDVIVSVKAGTTNIIVLEANFEHGVKTTQVDSASSVSAARIYARTDNTIGQNQIELCRVIVPSGATAVTKEMIVLKYRVNRAVGVEFSNEISSTEERKAATPLAVKTLHDLVDTKAPLDSPHLSGTPTSPTPEPGTNTTQIANAAFVYAAINALINGAPGTMDTLKEIAAAINNDPNFSTTINNALALKAPLASPALTGVPTAPTAAQGTNNTQIATTAYVRAAISALVGSSPEALDTLNELAAALGNDPNFATTMTRLIGEKVAKDGDTMTGKLILPQTSSFGINTNNILGGDSIAIGDSNTGIKHGGSGVLDLYSDGIHVLRYNKDAVISYKEILVGDSRHSINGDTYGSQWDNDWLSAYLNRRFSLCAGTEHNHDWGEINKVPNASINQSGIVQLSNETDSTSETMSATPRALHDSIMKHEEKENPHPQYLKKNLITDIGEKLISASDPEAVWAVIGSESEFEGDEYSWSIRFKNGFIIQGGKLPGYGKPLELVFRVPFTTAVLWHNALGYQAYSAGGGVAYYFMYSMANISLTGAKIGMLGCFRADSTQFIPTPSTMMGGKYIFMGY
ncbi:tail fiber protein [Escherichia coli]